ncbi:MAG: hypothetical protein R3F55_09995 [Alphaproteobacteria bacterium]
MTRPLNASEIRHLCGDILDSQVEAIVASGAEIADIETALAYAAGMDDAMGEARIPLAGRAAAVFEIIAAGEEYAEEDRAPR